MRNFLRRCVISLVGKDERDIRVQQVSYNGKADDAEIWAPYGMSYNLPPDCLSLYAQIGGDEGNLIVFPDRSQDRVKNLKEGEVSFFNPLTKTSTTYRKNGDLEIVTSGDSGDMSVTIKKDLTITVTGDVNITAGGDVDVTATNVNIDASATNLGVGGQPIARVGDSVEVTGVSSGSSTRTGTITSGGVNTSI